MQDFAATSGNAKTEDLSSNSSKNPEADQITHEEAKETDNLDTKRGEITEKGSEIVIDIDDKLENDEKVCRICHLNEESMEILQLGCDCKAELGVCHRHCAEAWFNQRGNSSCEICGKTAKNVETRILPEGQSRIMVIEWNQRTVEARRSSYITNSSAAALGLAGDRLVDISLASFFVCLICFTDSSFPLAKRERKVLSS